MANVYEGADAGALSTPYTLEAGDSFFGSLNNSVGDYDDYVRLNLNEGDIIRLTAEYIGDDPSSDPVEVLLLGEEGYAVGQTGKGRITNGETYRVYETGVHYAMVSTGGDVPAQDYRLDLTIEETPDFFDFTKKVGNVGGTIPYAGYTALFDVYILEEGSYRLVYDPFNDESSNANNLTKWAATLEELDGQLVVEGESTDPENEDDSTLYFDAEAQSQFLFSISGQDSDTGTFSLELERVHSVNSVDNSYGSLATMEGDEFANALIGSSSKETIYGFEGDDVIYGEGGKDRVFDGRGDDFVELGDGNDYVRAGGGVDSFYGGEGKDYISFYDSRNGVTLDLDANSASGSWANNDIVYGFESASGSKTGNDRMYGTSDANTFNTFGGNDKVYAGRGDDKVKLGSGNDYVRVGGGTETFDGGSGTDYISYYDSRNGVTVDLDADEVTGSWANNDTVRNFESVSGSKNGADTLLGTGTYNKMRGYGGDDLIDGRGGNDKLYGGSGDDTIIGGRGRDDHYGGSGADTFVFDIAESYFGYDIIHDFEVGVDTIRLIGFGFDETTDLSRYNEADNASVTLDFEVQGIRVEGVAFADISDSFEFG